MVCPCLSNSLTAASPTTPVPPVTSTFIADYPQMRGAQRLGRERTLPSSRRPPPRRRQIGCQPPKMSDRLSLDLVNSGDTRPEMGMGRGKLLSKAAWSVAFLALAGCAGFKEPYVVGAAGPWKQGYGL